MFGRLGRGLGRGAGKAVARSSGGRSFEGTAQAMLSNAPPLPLETIMNAPSYADLGIRTMGRSSAARGLRPKSSGGVPPMPRGGYRL